jgi:hypothetical protein
LIRANLLAFHVGLMPLKGNLWVQDKYVFNAL